MGTDIRYTDRFCKFFFLWIVILVTLAIPSYSQADCDIKGRSKLKFSLTGKHFGNDLFLEFSVITPGGDVMTNEITSDKIMDNINSSIKIKQIDLGEYTVIIRNKSDTSISIMGGIVATTHRFHKKPLIQKSGAFNLDLTPGEEIQYIYNTCTGFKIDEAQKDLLRWNPFDWL